MNSNDNQSVIKNEYQNLLIDILNKELYNGIKSIYSGCKKLCKKKNKKNILEIFQLHLQSIPTWSNNFVEKETKRILKKTECEYFKELITAVFLSYTQILSISSNMKEIDINIPNTNNFIHLCYRQMAKKFYVRPELLRDYDLNPWELQNNYILSINYIKESIKEAIRKYLPIRSIIKNYIKSSTNESDNESYDGDYIDNKKNKKNKKKKYKKEINTDSEYYSSDDSVEYSKEKNKKKINTEILKNESRNEYKNKNDYKSRNEYKNNDYKTEYYSDSDSYTSLTESDNNFC